VATKNNLVTRISLMVSMLMPLSTPTGKVERIKRQIPSKTVELKQALSIEIEAPNWLTVSSKK
jgi:hypothetical protein